MLAVSTKITAWQPARQYFACRADTGRAHRQVSVVGLAIKNVSKCKVQRHSRF
jgi:hypothetical protein